MGKTAVGGTKRPCCHGKTSFHLAQLVAQQESTSSHIVGQKLNKKHVCNTIFNSENAYLHHHPHPIPIAKSTV